jgi:protoheme IX farnesyltransferase
VKNFFNLTKFGIVIFVVLSAIAGYATSFQSESIFQIQHLLKTIISVYFLSSGSLALNQVQEYKLDRLMKRTEKRPIASGQLKPLAGFILAAVFIIAGIIGLNELSPLAGSLGVLTVLLYNGVYTYYWKPKWAFAAVPGAIPGALPVTIGYAVNSPDIFAVDSVYLFTILFLWQMPHFWCLAIRFKDDYADGSVPTLPVSLGMKRTLYHTGLYTFLYAFVAIASPWFVPASWFYILFVVPMTVFMLLQFYRFYKSAGEQNWFKFFMATNLSILVYLFIPIVDKWSFVFLPSV